MNVNVGFPWWIKNAALAGFGLVSMFAGALSPRLQTVGLILGTILVVVAGIGAMWHLRRQLFPILYGWRFQWPLKRIDATQGQTLGSRLWVGRMHVSIDKLPTESLVVLELFGFNGTHHKLRFDRLEGSISYCSGNESEPVKLPPAQFERLAWKDPLDPYTEFDVILNQRLPLDVAAALQTALKEDKKPEFRLYDLNVYLRSVDRPNLEAQVPMWGGVILTQRGSVIHAGRVVYASADIRLGASASVT